MILKKNDKVLYFKEYEAIITSVSPARATRTGGSSGRTYNIRFTDKIPHWLNVSMVNTTEENLCSADPNAELLEELREKVRAAGNPPREFVFKTEGSKFHKQLFEQLEEMKKRSEPLISHIPLDHCDEEITRMLELKKDIMSKLWKTPE